MLVIAEMLNGDRSHGSYGASVSAVSVRRLRKGVFGSATIVLEGPNTQLKLYVEVATGVADDQPLSPGAGNWIYISGVEHLSESSQSIPLYFLLLHDD